jgi:hypothetical protein
MKTVDAPLSPVNNPHPDDADLTQLRARTLEVWALAEIIADALLALPPGALDEKLQVLAPLLEDRARETHDLAARLVAPAA